jgi:hypothetical protein
VGSSRRSTSSLPPGQSGQAKQVEQADDDDQVARPPARTFVAHLAAEAAVQLCGASQALASTAPDGMSGGWPQRARRGKWRANLHDSRGPCSEAD